MRSKRRPHPSPWWPDRHSVWPEERDRWLARERSMALWLHGATTRNWVVRVLNIVSRVGDGWIWYGVIACLPWIGGVAGPSVAVRMIGVGTINLAIYWIVKRWIARPRPYRTCPGIRACTPTLDEFSFPSGHTLHAVTFSVILTMYYPHVAVYVWPFTILIAFSRIILGLHYPSDVVVGAVIGAITAGVSFNLL